MKVRRGVEVALNHHLFTAKLKLKLTKNWMETTTNMKIYNVSLTRTHRHRTTN